MVIAGVDAKLAKSNWVSTAGVVSITGVVSTTGVVSIAEVVSTTGVDCKLAKSN